MAWHEKARIIEPVVNMRLYDFIYIAANTADQPDIWTRENRMEDIADASANDNGHIILCENLESLPERKIIEIEFRSLDDQIILKINQQKPGAGIKNRWNPRFKNGYGDSVHDSKQSLRRYLFSSSYATFMPKPAVEIIKSKSIW